MAGSALAVAGLAGCAGPTGEGPVGEGPVAPAAAPGSTSEEGSETGTVTVTITSGEHAGVYEGEGSLKCNHGAFVPDGWWVVFASGAEEESPEVVNIINLWQAPEGQVDHPDSPYPGEQQLFDLWLGNPFLDGAKLSVNAADGGNVAVAGSEGNTVTFGGETAAGEAFNVVAECSVIKTE